MKRPFHKTTQKTALFSAVVVVIAAICIYDYKNQEVLKKQEISSQKAFLGWELNSVVRASVSRPNFSFVISKSNNLWKVIKPTEDLGDRSQIIFFIDDLLSQKLEPIASKETDNFGFDVEKTKVELSDLNGKKIVIEVGGEAPFSKGIYLKRDNKVYLGNLKWKGILKTRATHLRDHRVFPYMDAVVEVTALKVSSKKGTRYSLQKQKDKWIVLSPKNKTVSTEKVNKLVDSIGNIKATAIVDSGTDQKGIELFELKHPEVTFELSLFLGVEGKKTQENWKLNFGKKNAAAQFAQTSHRPVVLKLDPIRAQRINLSFKELQ